MKKIIRLTESDLARIVKRIIKESNPQNVNFDDLIGKTVKFTAIPSLTTWINSEYEEYTEESFDIEPLSNEDRIVWNGLKNFYDIKGRIKSIRVQTAGEGVEITLNDLQGNSTQYFGGEGMFYSCDEETFNFDYRQTSTDDTFFSDGIFRYYFSNKKLSENLENRLPCGNFDFAMNKSNNNDFA
jgi:hypothetical protein